MNIGAWRVLTRLTTPVYHQLARSPRHPPLAMAAQKKMTSFFSSKATPASPFDDKNTSPFAKKPTTDIPENVLKEKTPQKNKIIEKVKKEQTPKETKKPSLKKSPKEKTPKSIEKKLKSVTISETVKPSPVKESSPSPPSSPCSKPSKRRRVCVIAESDSEEDIAENVSPKKVSPQKASPKTASPKTASPPSTPTQSAMAVSDTETSPPPVKPHVTPKRKTAKLSKDFRSKIKNQTPHPSKATLSRQGSEAEPMDVSLTEELCEEAEEEPVTKKSKPAVKSPKSERKSPSPKKDTKSPKPTFKANSVKKASPETKPKKKDLSAFSFKKKETPKTETKDVKAEPSKATTAKASEGVYMPGKANYRPIEDACWKAGEVVPYKAIAYTMQEIEPESKRLRITEILCNFLRSVCILSPDDLHICIYLCTNQVAPAYMGMELGIGETVIMRALGEACGRDMKSMKEKMTALGDLGLVAEASRSNQKMMFKPKPLTTRAVFDTLYEISKMSGNSAQLQKIAVIRKLLVASQGPEARYITRSLCGKLRIGLAEQTVLVALGHATVMTPPGGDQEYALKNKNAVELKAEAAQIVKTCFCEHPDYEHVINAIKEHGVLNAEEYCGLAPGIPLKPMLAHPTKGISEVLKRFEGCEFTCEYKYDGERAQIHYSEDKETSIFSRNQENNTTKYPDIIARLPDCLTEGTNSFILDCEVVAWDIEKKQILPFQILTTRKRKDADINEIKVQVCLFAFDLLCLNGKSLVRKTFRERRDALQSAFKAVEGQFIFATATDCKNTEEIQSFLEESIKGQCEGLMVKTLDIDATYEISKRSHNWLKVKKDYLEGVADSLDLVVIGAYKGKGKRSGLYGGFLLACYDPETEQFQAVCKIGTGFTDEDLATHHKSLAEHVIEDAKSYYSWPDTNSPDVWFDAHAVWEVKCADLSISPIYTAAVGIVDPEKGISLRFPRFIRIRDDKTAEEATSSEQVAELYRNQDNKQDDKGDEDLY